MLETGGVGVVMGAEDVTGPVDTAGALSGVAIGTGVGVSGEEALHSPPTASQKNPVGQGQNEGAFISPDGVRHFLASSSYRDPVGHVQDCVVIPSMLVETHRAYATNNRPAMGALTNLPT